MRERDGEPVKLPFLRYYTAFNVAQIDGLDWSAIIPPADATDLPDAPEPLPACDAIVDGWQARPGVEHGGDLAAYVPARDVVRMPPRETFETAEYYYATLFHELGHATGAAHRLARPGIVDPIQFASHAYSREELVAEMTAAFLCAHAGLEDPRRVENHAAYCRHWIGVLRADAKAVVIAAAQAQKAADLILGVTHAGEEPAGEPADGQGATETAAA